MVNGFWIHDVGQISLRDPKDETPLRMVGIHRDINQEKKIKNA